MKNQSTRGRRPKGTLGDPVRSVRVSDEVWEKARRRATYEGVTMSHVLLTMVEGYAEGMLNLPRVTVSFGPPAQPVPPADAKGDGDEGAA